MAGFGLPINFYIKQNVQNPDDSFDGTITSTNLTINDIDGDKYIQQQSTLFYGNLTLTGTGIKKVEILMVGEGGDGGNSSTNASGAGGNGGEIIYYGEYELTAGEYWLTTSYGGSDIVALSKGTWSSPYLIQAAKGGGVAGGSSVNGMNNGNSGTPGITSSITGTATRYGWGGGSGACINTTLINTYVYKTGGSGGGGGLGNRGGYGGDGERLATNFIDSAPADVAGVNYGDGGGGASAVYAKELTTPFNYKWHTSAGSAGAGGTIIIRWTP